MKASEWIKTLPKEPSTQRQQMFLDAIYAGDVVINWCTVTLGTIELRVSTDVLQIGEVGDSVRVNVSAALQQKIADWFGCILPTAKICDAIYDQAKYKLKVHNQTPDQFMAYTDRMVRHSADIDNELKSLGCADLTELRADCGKDWVLTKHLSEIWKTKPTWACNYGWHLKGSSSGDFRADGKGRIIQSCGYAHDNRHEDYSQTCRLVYGKCIVNGSEINTADVYSDLVLSKLVCHDGPLTISRMNGIAYENPQEKLVNLFKI